MPTGPRPGVQGDISGQRNVPELVRESTRMRFLITTAGGVRPVTTYLIVEPAQCCG